ncbi:hypothetical protein DXG01_012871 [Tephrocybe rancida]|nr:hypothetical protein DXG01_012871 [Tephrocybe rancida]
MHPKIPPGSVLEAEWLLNEQHEQQERKRDQSGVQLLLAQQVSSPPLPPVATLSIRDSPRASPVVDGSSRSSSRSASASGDPISDSSSDEDTVIEQDELDVEDGDMDEGSDNEGSEDEGDGWGGIPTIVSGSRPLAHPAHLDFVSEKLFVEVMRVLRLRDPTPEWCAAARASASLPRSRMCSNCTEHGIDCTFVGPEKKRRQIPCVPCRKRRVKCPLRDVWLAELGEQTMGWPRLWCLERLPNIGHLEAAGPQVPLDDLFAVWQRAAAGVPLPNNLSTLPGGPLVPPSPSAPKIKRTSSAASNSPPLQGEGNVVKGKQRQVTEEDDVDEGLAVGKVGTRHLRRAKKQRVVSPPPSPSPSPPVPRIRLDTPLQPPPPAFSEPLFLPSSGGSTPVGVPRSPLPAPSFPASVPAPVSGLVPPADHPLIDLDSDAEISAPAPPPHAFSMLQPQRVHPLPPPYFVEPLEDGEVVDGLEAGLSTMSPSETPGVIQQELNSLTPKQLRNLLLRVKGQHQTEFKHMEEAAKGWREAISFAQGLAIGEHRRGLNAVAIDMGTESWQHTRENAQLFEGGLHLPSVEDVRRHFFDNPRVMSPQSRREVKREGGEPVDRASGMFDFDWEHYDDLEGLYGPDPNDLEGRGVWGSVEGGSPGLNSKRKWEEAEAGPSKW